MAMHFGPVDSGVAPFAAIAVSDGMGGMIDGEHCAILTLATFFRELLNNRQMPLESRLRTATLSANAAVFRFAGGKGGATLSAVLIDQTGQGALVNVGDSRIYAVSHNDQLQRLTVDDTLEEAFGGHGRELVQFVGLGDGIAPRVTSFGPGFDQLLLTSDGVHFIPPDLLQAIILKAQDPRRAADRLLALARWLGGPDNATIAAFRPNAVIDFLKNLTPSVQFWTPADGFTLINLFATTQQRAALVGPAQAEPKLGDSSLRSKPRPKRDRKRKVSGARSEQPELQVTVTMDDGGDDKDR